MIRSLRLENFMAHGDTVVPLGPGLTALTGPNNVGKSAVVEALRCLATNPAPRHFIRHGAKEARVSVELEDGLRVVWIRRKASAGYEIWRPGAEAPEEYWKLGRSGVPEEVQAALRLPLVELESGEPVDVHLGDQRQPVFLLNQPPSAAAAFFAASTESAHLLAMQNLLKRRVADAKRDAAQARARRDNLEAGLDRLAALPDLSLALGAAREEARALESSRERLAALEEGLARRTVLHKRLSGLRERAEALRNLPRPPEVADTARPSRLLAALRQTSSGLATARSRSLALEPLAAAPELFPADRLARLLASMNRLKQQEKIVEESSGPLAGLQPSPTLPKTADLAGTVARMADLRDRAQECRKSLDACGSKLHSLQERIAARLEEIGACPTCGAALDFDRFARRGDA